MPPIPPDVQQCHKRRFFFSDRQLEQTGSDNSNDPCIEGSDLLIEEFIIDMGVDQDLRSLREKKNHPAFSGHGFFWA